jgi:hypothetical protein
VAYWRLLAVIDEARLVCLFFLLLVNTSACPQRMAAFAAEV